MGWFNNLKAFKALAFGVIVASTGQAEEFDASTASFADRMNYYRAVDAAG